MNYFKLIIDKYSKSQNIRKQNAINNLPHYEKTRSKEYKLELWPKKLKNLNNHQRKKMQKICLKQTCSLDMSEI